MNSFVTQISWIERHFKEVLPSAEVCLEMKYATDDNFMKKNVYQGFERCFLAPLAYDMFQQACAELKEKHRDLRFVIWDTLRPRHVQAEFYEHLRGTPFQNYVAAPAPGSLHNFGMAMDLTLQKKTGEYLDMGTGFDDFRDLAQPKLETQFLDTGELSPEQYQNRRLLRDLLESRGFKVLEHEWWHFNALPKEQVYGKFPILE